MGLFSRPAHTENADLPVDDANAGTQVSQDPEKVAGVYDDSPVKFLTLPSFAMGVLVSMGGFIFGYDTGQISGFLQMKNFLQRFGQDQGNGTYKFSNVRSGLIVGLLSIGTLAGALAVAPIADRIGRKYSMSVWSTVFIVGVIIQMASETSWVQIAIGRLIAGSGVGALSIMVPMYTSETGPRQVRGSLVSTYQLFITAGIFTADAINFGTEARPNAGSWRIPMGIGFIWPLILGLGILFFPESPRYAYRKGRVEEARTTMAKFYGVSKDHREVQREIGEIKEKHDLEVSLGKRPWIELITGPRMAYRTALGIVLQALQQLTGANFFFYYGTTIFQATGISNSYVTAMILGGVNFGMTFPGLYVVERFGRRRALIVGGVGMTVNFLIFASVGAFALDNANPTATPAAGAAMIVFACLFIAFYATTWGPIIWCIVGELFPSHYRARSMALVTSSNWTWNFLIAFFTPFIIGDIGFKYGYVFAGCNFAAVLIVYFFVCETQGRTLEEIDTMYISKVKPWKSSEWVPPSASEEALVDRSAYEERLRG
ncbi:hexose transporter hxt1 [Imshaugia aleurites]|uniref:Hexose transporter hxt1 n=1 Tax=Imshaugia aleurites TaxID=172621 RepID=A0A8H3F3U3_9LECA|nr:hexose transporter hxt1 [Imshaugia aleurites]